MYVWLAMIADGILSVIVLLKYDRRKDAGL